MSSESGDQNPARLQNTMSSHPPPPRTDPLPCPRCASTNTKFCYYNNYNLSQPRYFCKGCRRYWTQGGTLRNVPVGGGTRKSSTSKRHRSSTSSSSSNNNTTNTNTTSSASSTLTHEPGPEFEPDPILLPLPANPVSVLPVKVESNDMNLNESLGLTVNLNESYPVSGNFATFLDIQGPGSLNMGGYGLDEMGLGFGPTRVWPFLGTGGGYLGSVNGNNGGGGGGGGGGGSTVGCNNTWQMGDVENGGGVVDGDCYGWPGLAISTPGKGLK